MAIKLEYTPGPHQNGPNSQVRTEYYPYPYESGPPGSPYPYQVLPPMDSSLIPTSKHFIVVSFIGLLLLFAIIQNSIVAAKRKDAIVEVLSNRKKREITLPLDNEKIVSI